MSNQRISGFINRIRGGGGYSASPGKRSKTKLGPRGKFLTAAAISFTLHGGAVAIDSLIRVLNRPSQNQFMPLIEDAGKMAEIKRQALLDKLKAKKNDFIRRVFRDVHDNKRMPISDFAVKSETLDKNIEALEAGSGEIIDEKEMRDRYQTLLKHAREWVGDSREERKKIEELHRFSHYRMFRAYLEKSGRIIDILLNGVYNCISSSKFMAALEDDVVGSENFGVIVLDPPKDPSQGKLGHMLGWYRGMDGNWQIEGTNGAPPRMVPFEKGLHAPKEIFMAAYLISNGVRLDRLPERIRQYYKRGIGRGGYPIAGISTDLPDPPDSYVPNPYFGKKEPQAVTESTRKLYEGMRKKKKRKKKKPLTTEEIIKEAKIDVMASTLFRTPQRKAGPIIFSSFEVPNGIDWCKVADVRYYFSPNEFYEWGQHNVQQRLRYLTAIGTAKTLSDLGDRRFKECTPEAEYRKFERVVKKLLKGRFDEDQRFLLSRHLLRGLSDPVRARKKLHMIVRKFGAGDFPGIQALGLLAIIGSSRDFDFFRLGLLETANEEGLSRINKMQVSSNALLYMGKKPENLVEIFRAAFEREEDDPHYTSLKRVEVLEALGRIGYGVEVLRLKEKLDPILDIRVKRDIIYNISRLRPGRAADEDIQKVSKMVQEEEDHIIKVNLLALLASEGRMEEALEYLKALNETELYNYFESQSEDPPHINDFIRSLGKINSSLVGEKMLSLLYAYPDPGSAIAIGRIFLEHNCYSDGNLRMKIIKELKRILHNDFYASSDRQKAAVLLIQMGAL